MLEEVGEIQPQGHEPLSISRNHQESITFLLAALETVLLRFEEGWNGKDSHLPSGPQLQLFLFIYF